MELVPGVLDGDGTFFFGVALVPGICVGFAGLFPFATGLFPGGVAFGVLGFAMGETSGELLPPGFLLLSGESALAMAWLLDFDRFGAFVSWIKSMLLSMVDASLLAMARSTPLSEVDNLTIELLPPMVPSR